MKKVKFGIISLLCLFFGFDASAYNVGGIEYDFDENQMTATVVSAYDLDYSGDIVIPSEVYFDSHYYTVTAIGNNAFQFCTELTSVKIPNTVTSIGSGAFVTCTSLGAIELPPNLSSIGNYAFLNCTKLSSLVIPDAVLTIGKNAFGFCESLSSIKLSESIHTIENNTFEDCISLTSIVIPNSVKSIDYEAFDKCSKLLSVTLPNSVEKIGARAFNRCSALNSIKIPSRLDTIEDELFSGCTSLSSIEIPAGVKLIKFAAFAECKALTSIHIPSSVDSIHATAFSKCIDLSTITVDSSNKVYCSNNSNAVIRKKDNTLILGCKTSTIPDNVVTIGEDAFNGCESMTSIEFPKSVTKISKSAFAYCRGLKSFDVPTSVTYIGDNAFSGCSELLTVNIPNSVKKLGKGAFSGCLKLNYAEIPSSISVIEDETFSACFSMDYVELPETITKIGASAFDACHRLVRVNLPNSITSIGESAFAGCGLLRSVKIPESVTKIEPNTFNGCDNLSEVYIPYNVTSIPKDCFKDCGFIKSLTVQNLKTITSSEAGFFLPHNEIKDVKIQVSPNGVLDVDESGNIQFLKPGVATAIISGKLFNQNYKFTCNITVAGYPLTIGNTGYCTFSAPSDYVIPEGLKAGIVELANDQANITYLPSNQLGYSKEEALILKGEPGEYFIETPWEPTNIEKNTSNSLKPAHTNNVIKADPENELFVLSNGNDGLGFYYQMGCPDGSFVKDLKGKAYLDIPKTDLMGLNSLRLFDAETTGIEEVEKGNNSPVVIYSLSGVKVNQSLNQLPKGVYIVNGKKVMVK